MSNTAEDYYWTMAARNRLIRIEQPEYQAALCTFFVLQDEQEIPRFYNRLAWSTPLDSADGDIVLIDTYYGRFSRAIVTLLEQAMVKLVPSYTQAIWYRLGARSHLRHTYYRGRSHASYVHG